MIVREDFGCFEGRSTAWCGYCPLHSYDVENHPTYAAKVDAIFQVIEARAIAPL
jgi:hypothetical protein